MQGRSGAAGGAYGKRVKDLMKRNQKWLLAVCSAGTGLAMANASVFGGISPFGVAFCAAMQGSNAIAAALGAVVGYAFAGLADMKYIAAVLLVAVAKWLFGKESAFLPRLSARARSSVPAAVLTAFFAMLIAGAAVVFTADYTVYDIIMAFSEVLLASGAAYFFTRAVASLSVGWNGAAKLDASCVVISFAIVVMGFADFEIAHLSLGRMISVLVILLCARYGGEAGGAVAGVTAGMAMALSGADMAYVVAAYAFGGLVAGLCGNMGRMASAVAFIVANAVISLITQNTTAVFTSLAEVFVASVVFTAIPQGWMSRLRPMQAGAAANDATQGILRDRLGDISLALQNVAQTTRKVGEGLEKMGDENPMFIPARITERVCAHCGRKAICWQKDSGAAMDAMSTALQIMKQTGSISRENAPRYLSQNCVRLDNLLTELNVEFLGQTSRENLRRKVARVRAVVAEQFEGMSLMLDEVAGELCAVRVMDDAKARRVRDYFEKEGIAARRIQAYTDEQTRMRVAFMMPDYELHRLRKTKATLDLCGLLEAEFDLPLVKARKHGTTVTFTEKAAFTLDCAAYQIAGEGNAICGDTYEIIDNQNGKAHLILSDGMGSGGGAAVDSKMAAGLISELLSVGAGYEPTLKMVNSALIIKSGEESLATIDVTTVDLFNGHVDFFKAGAAPTYLLKNGRAGYVDSTSLPAGILSGAAFEHNSVALRENDMIVMVSDGVTATGVEWVRSELESMRAAELSPLCEKLAKTAMLRRTDGREDDITVVAAALRKVE